MRLVDPAEDFGNGCEKKKHFFLNFHITEMSPLIIKKLCQECAQPMGMCMVVDKTPLPMLAGKLFVLFVVLDVRLRAFWCTIYQYRKNEKINTARS